MNLYLIQHAEAKQETEDPRRGLNETGKSDINRTGEYFAMLKPIVEELWHSNKLRAKQTAELLATCIQFKGKVKECANLLPNNPVDEIKNELNNFNKNLIIIGHLPFLSRLSSLLLVNLDKQNIIDFKNAGIVCLKRDDISWSIEWIITPESIPSK